MVEFHNRSSQALAEDFKEITLARLATLEKYSKKISKIKVEILEGSSHKLKSESHEVHIQVVTNSEIYKGEGRGSSNLIAFDEAFLVVESQLRKEHSKRSTAKTRKPGLKSLPPADQ